MAAYNESVVTEAIARRIADLPRGAKAKLARDVGVAPQTVSKWIQHEVCPEPEKWPAIERSLGMDEGELAAQADLQPGGGTFRSELGQLRAEISELRDLMSQVPDILERLKRLDSESGGR